MILAIIVTDFREPRERATAMSVYTFIVSSGGSIGLLAGGSLTEALGWHWIFFINLPIGALAFFLGRILIEESPALGLRRGVDWMGAVLVTGATMLIVYAIVKAAEYGWGRPTRSASPAPAPCSWARSPCSRRGCASRCSRRASCACAG